MLIADVNVFITANREDSPDNAAMRSWLEDRLDGHERFGVCDFVLSAMVRIVTNRRLYNSPATPEEAIAFCDEVRAAPATALIAPGVLHWEIFADLVRTTHATANLVPDAYLAALALENGATFVTRDRGFARFPGLRLLDPLAA